MALRAPADGHDTAGRTSAPPRLQLHANVLPVITWVARHVVAIVGVVRARRLPVVVHAPSADDPIRSDGFNFYLYAPSWLIYHDTTLEALSKDWYGGAYPAFSGMLRWPGTDRWMNRHPIGVTVLMFPFVLVADLLTRWSNLPRDGFSFYYQHAAALAGLAYFLAGLAVLRRTLSRYFSPVVTLWTLVAITLGTNLFHYAVYDGTFSHAFSFALICALVELSDLWWTQPTALARRGDGPCRGADCPDAPYQRRSSSCSFRCGGSASWSQASAAESTSSGSGARAVLAMAAVAAVAAGAAGRPLQGDDRSLARESLRPAQRRIHVPVARTCSGRSLSTQRGLFFWSPVLLFAVAGMFVARGWARQVLAPTAVVVLGLNAWLIASWTEWQFGASYGHRAFIDSLGVLALFLAAFFAWTREHPRLLPVGRGGDDPRDGALRRADDPVLAPRVAGQGHYVGPVPIAVPDLPMTRTRVSFAGSSAAWRCWCSAARTSATRPGRDRSPPGCAGGRRIGGTATRFRWTDRPCELLRAE